MVPEFGIPKLKRLPEVYAASDQLVFSLDMLDPTSSGAQPALPPIIGERWNRLLAASRFCIYFSTTEKSDPGLMEAIGDLGVRVRAYSESTTR